MKLGNDKTAVIFYIPGDRRYLPTHEWLHRKNGTGSVGITDFAQDELGDVIFIELPEVGETLDKEAQLGAIESIKAMSELYVPMSGTVTDVNERLTNEPELVNDDPYGDAWMVQLDFSTPNGYDELLSAEEYSAQVK